MNGTNNPLKIAILINGFESPNTPLVRDSFVAAIKSALPSALPRVIDFYDPIVAQSYPNLQIMISLCSVVAQQIPWDPALGAEDAELPTNDCR